MKCQPEEQVIRDDGGSRLCLLLPVMVTLAILGCRLLIFRIFGSIPDTSWLMTVLDRMSAGDRLYVDVIETNPPFSIWLYMPPYFVAKALGVAPELATEIYTFLICVLGVGATCWLMLEAGLSDVRKNAILYPALLTFAALLAGNAWTERDQIGAILSIPLFVLVFWRFDLSIRQRPKPRHWLAAGSLGGVLPLAKPHYAVVYVIVALWLAYKRRDIRILFLPEFLIPAAILLIYLVVAYLAYPGYFRTVLPLLNETYLTSRLPFWVLFLYILPVLILFRVAIWNKSGKKFQDLSKLLIAGSAAALLPYFFQGKGWAYHQYLAILLASLSILLPLMLGSDGVAFRSPNRRPSYSMIAACLALLLAHGRFYIYEIPPKDFVQKIRHKTHDPTVAVLGGDIAAAFPLTRMIGGRWIEPYCSDWIIVFAARLQKKAVATGNELMREHYVSIADRYATEKLARLEENPPELILLDHGKYSGKQAKYLMARPGYASLMNKYRKIADSDRMAAYLRVGAQ